MKKAILVCVLLAILILAGCKTPEAEPEAAAAEEIEEEEEAVAEEEAAPTALLSGVSCTGGVISGTITNVKDEEINVQKDIRVLIRGLVVANALLECNKATLQPGESTKCAKLNGLFQTMETNQVVVRLGMNQEVVEVDCE